MGGAIDKGHQEAGKQDGKSFGSNLVKGLKGIGNVLNKGLAVADTVSGALGDVGVPFANKIHNVTQMGMGIKNIGEEVYRQAKGVTSGAGNYGGVSNKGPESYSKQQYENNIAQYGQPMQEPSSRKRISSMGGGNFDGGVGKTPRKNVSYQQPMGTKTALLGTARTYLGNSDIVRHTKTSRSARTEMGLVPKTKTPLVIGRGRGRGRM
jgi:hypothetical protein